MNNKELGKVTRVEVIDEKGRSYVNWDRNNQVTVSLQDNERTLKIFIEKKRGDHVHFTKPFPEIEGYKVIHDKDYPPELFEKARVSAEGRKMSEEEMNEVANRFAQNLWNQNMMSQGH